MIPVYHFSELPSTNDYLKAIYRDLRQDCIVLADQQTAGRGRFDRIWHSNRDLTFSMLCHDPDQYAVLTPLVIVHALRTFGYEAMIKWPNDILYQSRKISGILIEDMYEGKCRSCSIIGIGVNLHKHDEKDFTSAYAAISRDMLMPEFLKQWQKIKQLDSKERISVYRRYSMLIGETVLLNQETWSVKDIDEAGHLLIERDNQLRCLNSEEITLHQSDGRYLYD